MRQLYAIILLGTFTFFGGCGGDDGTRPQDDAYEVHDSATVGAEGGVLEGDDFVATIPAGALDADYDLELRSSGDEQPWGETTASDVYVLDGVPEDYASPLEFLLPGSVDRSDTVLVAVGTETFVPSLAANRVSYRLVRALPCEGGHCFELPVTDIGEGGKAEGKGVAHAIWMFRTINLTWYQPEGGHFCIYYPRAAVDASDIENNLNTWLEDAHTKFADDLGFGYTGQEWPMEVYAYPIPNTPNGGIVGGCWVPHLLGANYGWIEFNTDYISDEQIGKTVCGHEFFHFIQYLYDPRSAFDIVRHTARHLWLMEASSVWSEELFVDDPDAYVSLSLALFPGACLDRYGLQPGEDVAASSNAAHGYGLGGLIRYLVGTYGMDRMRAIWANIKIDAHPVAAIISAVGEQPGVWWPHYLDQYLVGDIYNQTGAAFQPMVVDSFVIAGNADTEHVFTAEYPDISARLFKIKLENADLHDDAILNFAVDGQDPVPDLTVFKRQGPDIELLTRGQGAVSITDVRDLMQSGWEVLVLVQNCKATPPDYDGSRVLSLRVRQAVQPSWQRAYIRISLDAMVRDGEGVVQQQEDLVFWAQAAVSQMGTSINEVWLEPVAGGTETGEMEVYFNPTYTKIDSFRFVRNVQYDNGGTAHQAARGEDIAFDESDGTMDFYRYEGLQAQDHVGQLEHHFDLGYNSRELESIIWDVETNNISIVLDDLPPVRMHRRSEQAGSLTR